MGVSFRLVVQVLFVWPGVTFEGSQFLIEGNMVTSWLENTKEESCLQTIEISEIKDQHFLLVDGKVDYLHESEKVIVDLLAEETKWNNDQ